MKEEKNAKKQRKVIEIKKKGANEKRARAASTSTTVKKARKCLIAGRL